MNYIAASHLLTTVLSKFLSKAQFSVLKELIFTGEEVHHFREKVGEYATRIANMPKTYEQDGKGEDATVYLHYFQGGMDAWVTEKDQEEEQQQAFGRVDLGYGPELGYISIQELADNGFELDLHWEPKALKECKR